MFPFGDAVIDTKCHMNDTLRDERGSAISGEDSADRRGSLALFPFGDALIDTNCHVDVTMGDVWVNAMTGAVRMGCFQIGTIG